MRIAQVSPLYERVPPLLYGGTERVVSYLTEELVRQGHDVTLFASGDSLTRARLVPGAPRALRLATRMNEDMKLHAAMLQTVYAMRDSFDVIHLHVDDWQVLEPRLLETPHVTTVHGRLDMPARRVPYQMTPELRLVSISNAQRAPLPRANWLGTVYHGMPRGTYTVRREPGSYLTFVGRISPEKGVHRAVTLAERFGMPLRLAAKIEHADRAYYESIADMLRAPHVEFLGEADERMKDELLGGAYAFVFPIDWPEPFGLAMIEAMACGTPVVAWRNGSIPELVDEGVTGFVVRSEAEAMEALTNIRSLDRARCAMRAAQRFSAERMARDYVRIYERVAQAVDAPMLGLSAGAHRHARPGE